MSELHVTLKPTEQAVVCAAATIYAGYLTSNRVPEGEESKWLKQSIKDAVMMAQITDKTLIADDELG